MADSEAIQLLGWLKEVAEGEGGSVQDDAHASGQPAHTDAAGFAALGAHALTVRFARAGAARTFLAKTAGTILEMEEWSRIAIVIEVGGHSFPLRAGIEKTDEDLKALSDAGG